MGGVVCGVVTQDNGCFYAAGILAMGDQAGIEGALIDTAMPAWGIGVGAGLRSIYLIKEQYGDRGAVGTGIGNVSDTLGWVKGNFPKN
ncbi:hypothetical protein GH146_01285, partial [archaeon]|nr:hypothetical protein [archaeon]